MTSEIGLYPPPKGGPGGGPPAETCEELMTSLNAWAGSHGYALVRRNAGNYREGKPTCYMIFCDRGQDRGSQSRGARNSSSSKVNCPFKGRIRALKSDNHRWTFQIINPDHNHPPSRQNVTHTVLRRLTEDMKLHIKSLAKDGIRVREIEAGLHSKYPDHPFITKDITNYVQRLRIEQLNSLISNQALVKLLRDQYLLHTVKMDPENPNRLQAIFWTYPQCEEKWKLFLTTASFDKTDKTNRFHSPFFNKTGPTATGSICNSDSNIVPDEPKASYDSLITQYDSFRRPIGEEDPEFVTTEIDIEPRKTVTSILPDSQQKVCVFYLNKNVILRTEQKWQNDIRNNVNSLDIETDSIREPDEVVFVESTILDATDSRAVQAGPEPEGKAAE